MAPKSSMQGPLSSFQNPSQCRPLCPQDATPGNTFCISSLSSDSGFNSWSQWSHRLCFLPTSEYEESGAAILLTHQVEFRVTKPSSILMMKNTWRFFLQWSYLPTTSYQILFSPQRRPTQPPLPNILLRWVQTLPQTSFSPSLTVPFLQLGNMGKSLPTLKNTRNKPAASGSSILPSMEG